MVEGRRRELSEQSNEELQGVLTSLLRTEPFSNDPVLLNTLVTDLFLGAVDTVRWQFR